MLNNVGRMAPPIIDSLPIAIRVYPQPVDMEERKRPRKGWRYPEGMLVFDTESRVDAPQRLTFGSYRLIVGKQCLEEGLFYGDDLPKQDQQVLERYVGEESHQGLQLLTRREFVKRVYKSVYKSRDLLVGFNLPFDLSRIAFDYTDSRGRFAGGFALELWSYLDKTGHWAPNPHRPRIAIKHIDSKRSLMGLTARKLADDEDKIPEGSESTNPQEGYIFRGHFLDLRTLAFALTDVGYTLDSACEEFGVEHGKQRIKRHGIVTAEYIDYNRRDVLATSELAAKLIEEYDKHPIAPQPNDPITLQPTKAYSPASIGKAYLRKMKVDPILERQPDFPKEYLGYAQSAFFGGRTSAHIRKTAVPVVYCDFLSMYPTVNSLMNMWQFVIAREIKIVEHCQAEMQDFVRNVTAHDLFSAETWKQNQMLAFARVIPNGDILPTRAKYNVETKDWQVGINHLYALNDDHSNALWFTLPDIIASKILTNKAPDIVDAFRIEAHGMLPGLEPTWLRGTVPVDPKSQDFFRLAIEERQRLALRTDISATEKDRLRKALKVLANAASYGIYAQMDRRESDRKVDVTCYGMNGKYTSPRVRHPEEPGEYCFSPMASLITGGARLMLALLEYSVQKLGGTYAMEDTDSMAIVATEHGGQISIPRGAKRGRSVVQALTWKQVEGISKRFSDDLVPYKRDAVPDSILKIEADNLDPRTKKQRQLWCVAISAKRYALFVKDEAGQPILLRASCPHCGRKNKPDAVRCKNLDCNKPIQPNNEEDRWSEHGLGHLLNPTDPEDEDREWIANAWLNIVRDAERLPVDKLGFEQSPAIGRITISSPTVMKPMSTLNSGKPYWDRIKPFNFLLTSHVRAFGHPLGIDPEHFHLIAPYETGPKKWLQSKWIDQYSGKQYRITTANDYRPRDTARVKTHGEVLREYEFHPESKCADIGGKPCDREAIGLLQRRHVRIESITPIGKESNNLEGVEAAVIHSEQEVYTPYPDPARDEWHMKIWPALKDAPLTDLVELCRKKISRRAIIDARAGRSKPYPRNQTLLTEILRKLGCL